ncbi:hypothetical protein [Corynebacterium ulcerans]|uniref:hypothetical protein n=1 Tax=Corynebacterium ulcerans TaxID=65058 RepID=UPI000C75D830|nr:hypothetical protein [Corynebacterium ulcerans]
MMSTRILALATAIFLTSVLSACSLGKENHDGSDAGMSPPEITTWTQPSLPPGISNQEVDQTNPDAVGVAAMQTFFAWKPGVDETTADAAKRSIPLMDEDFAASRANSWSAMTGLPGYLWEKWTSEKTTTTVTVKESKDQRPEDQPRHVWRQYRITVEVSNGDSVAYDVFAELEELGWWRISALKITAPQIVESGGNIK